MGWAGWTEWVCSLTSVGLSDWVRSLKRRGPELDRTTSKGLFPQSCWLGWLGSLPQMTPDTGQVGWTEWVCSLTSAGLSDWVRFLKRRGPELGRTTSMGLFPQS